MMPVVDEELSGLLGDSFAGKNVPNWRHDHDVPAQFRAVVDGFNNIPSLRAIILWQAQEITATLVGCRASSMGIRVDYRSPCRYLMLLSRIKAITAGDFSLHATRKDIVGMGQSYLGSEASVRRLIVSTEAKGLITLVSLPGRKGSIVVPSAEWMYRHCCKQLITMLARYAHYRSPIQGDELAAATFQNRWVRVFGFSQTALELSERCWGDLSI